MSGFVDSPFLFFVDNVPPIFADHPEEDQRKIIEISDVGCDAVSPTMTLQNNGQYNPARTSTIRNNRIKHDERTANKIHKEKPRQNDGPAKDFGKTFIKQPEINHRPNIDEQRWKKQPTHDDAINAATAKRSPDTKDVNTSSRVQSAKPRLNRWSRGNVPVPPSEVQWDHETACPQKRPLSCPTRKRPLIPQSAIPRIVPKMKPRIDETPTTDKEKTMVALEPDYPEVFDRHVSKDRWQGLRAPMPRIAKKPSNENLRRTHRASRYRKNPKIASAKADNVEEILDELEDRRIRSRTHSPPRDRHGGTRSCSKPGRKQPEQVEVQQIPRIIKDPQRSPKSSLFNLASDRAGNTNRDRSSERSQRFVDRAVDKDSISDIARVSTSTDATVAPTSSIDTGKSEKVIGFWEFVPLDDENRRKIPGNRRARCVLDQRLIQDTEYHPPRRHLVNENDAPMTDKKSLKRSLDLDRPSDSESLKYVDRYLNSAGPGGLEEVPDTYRIDKSARSVEVLHRTRIGSKTEVNRDGSREKLCSNCFANDARHSENCHGQSCGEPRYQPKVARMQAFGWTGYSRSLKRENEARHGMESEKRKKMENEDNMAGIKFVEKAAARLKRKLEDSLNEDSVSRKFAGLNIEKKIRSELSTSSRLPIRIGNRLRSKNPIAWKFRGCPKNRSSEKEENENPANSGSIRSRTKPRIKPSVEHHRIIIDSDETPACQKTVDDVRRNGDSSVDETIKRGRDEQFRGAMRYANVEHGPRRNEFTNRFYAREINQGNGSGMSRMETNVLRNGLREKCFFNVHDQENSICGKHCKGLCCG
nr:uncharacterized protein LOC117223749 [Megalopta genalis]XP_033332126.1 uncharacterized protein LOC117223749 [Megalopta genalis]